MITQNRGTIAFAVCGSFCTLEAALQSARALTAQGWQLLPVMSFAARQDTRFGTGNYWKEQLEAAAGHPVLDTLQAVEPLGPRKMAQALVVAPCTGATLSRLAAGLSDTPVTLAAKSLLRVGCPVVLAVSTNDGLGASGENIARLFQRKHYYFVPYGQDDPAAKPQSLKADFARLPAALEAALRVYNGKAAVNSVNGEEKALQTLLPVVKKYGAAVVGLALDEKGLPKTAAERVAIAKRIVAAAERFGIPREDVFIDCLTLTVSAQQDQAEETLAAVRTVHRDMGLQTVLGVSNISFGLPNRLLMTQTFLIRALNEGLTLPIINPNQKEIMDAVAAFRVLSGEDEACAAYVERFGSEAALAAEKQRAAAVSSAPTAKAAAAVTNLDDAIIRGLKADAARLAKEALATENELSLVEST